MNIKYGMFFIVGCSWISIQANHTYESVNTLHLTGPENQTVIHDLLSSLPKDRHKATDMKIDALKKFAETVQDPNWAKSTRLTSWNPEGNLLYLERFNKEEFEKFLLNLTCRGESMNQGRRAVERKVSFGNSDETLSLKVACYISKKERFSEHNEMYFEFY